MTISVLYMHLKENESVVLLKPSRKVEQQPRECFQSITNNEIAQVLLTDSLLGVHWYTLFSSCKVNLWALYEKYLTMTTIEINTLNYITISIDQD